ncbi:GAP family protein [Nocardioides renjunii]|uniref:GAP family protein n=1 Tax=Nocardioides renjunii TaxID=3095075 RepID=UPI002AFE4235|nr:GAP family protein [Nocardioides sp. S-34]WQQ23798.1 GAP family protein [Nocardioides sp. S-34]
MTWQLAGSIAGLAALDSLNPATLVAITLILLGSRRRPLAEALGFVIGAFATVFLLGLALYVGAEAAASSISGALTWLRRGAFGLAAVVLFVSSVRSLRARRRSAVGLPAWFTPLTAAGLGVVMTGADLPNAFPYFIAIERLLAAGVATPTAVVVLALYALVYCLPCLVLLALGLSRGERVMGALRRLHDRFGTSAVIPPSRWRAAGFFLAGVAVTAIAVSV